MSMTNALVAATCNRDRLYSAVFQVWDCLQVTDRSPELHAADELGAWVQAHNMPQAVPSRYVAAFWQDGNWAVLSDCWTMTFVWDNERLARLSAHVSPVFAAMTQGTSGTASFAFFENGALRREISHAEGRTAVQGMPIPAETGITVDDRFYVSEVEDLCQALGLSDYWYEPLAPALAVQFRDLRYEQLPGPSPRRKRPWWRWWA